MKWLIGALFLSCMQRFSDNPPIHVNPNMDVQPVLKAQAYSEFFPDGRASRSARQGAVARDEVLFDEGRQLGYVNGVYLEEFPFPMTQRDLTIGKNTYSNTCAHCHGIIGRGDGFIYQYGMYPPMNLHLESVVAFPVGYIFHTLAEGVRDRMPKMTYQIPDVDDRWRVVAYVRALQMSQRLLRANIPEDVLAEKGW